MSLGVYIPADEPLGSEWGNTHLRFMHTNKVAASLFIYVNRRDETKDICIMQIRWIAPSGTSE